MASYTLTIEAEYILGNYYPKGSDTPVPDGSVVEVNKNPLDGLQSRGNLKVGDLILDALGRPWVVRTLRDGLFFDAEVLAVDSADKPTMPRELSQLEAPLTLLAREGDRIADLVMYR